MNPETQPERLRLIILLSVLILRQDEVRFWWLPQHYYREEGMGHYEVQSMVSNWSLCAVDRFEPKAVLVYGCALGVIIDFAIHK